MKKRILLGLLLILMALSLYIIIDYSLWRQNTINHLQNESIIAETALGPIEYEKMGNGPVILIIHGTPGGYDQGIFTAKILNKTGYTYISPSRPGYLRTPLSVGKTPEEQADSFVALLDELNIESAYILAVSGGGPSALQFALKYPDRCKGLILLSALTQPPKPMEFTPTEKIFNNMMETLLTTDFGNWALYELLRANPTMAIPQDPEIQLPNAQQEKLFLELYDTLFPGSLRIEGINNDTEQINNMADFPFTQIKVPTLILHGTNDRNVPFETAKFAANNISNATFIPIEGGVHEFFVVLQRHNSLINEIFSFIRSNS